MSNLSFLENYKLEGELLEIHEFPDPILKKMAKESDSILLFILENRHFIQKEIIGIEKSTPEQIL